MASNISEKLKKIAENNLVIDGKISLIENKIDDISNEISKKNLSKNKSSIDDKTVDKIKEGLLNENELLKNQINSLLEKLNISAEEKNQTEKVNNNNNKSTKNDKKSVEKEIKKEKTPEKLENNDKKVESEEKKSFKKKKQAGNENKTPQPKQEEKPIDVGRLDLRIGKILEAIKHPDADSLYVEKIDLGDEKPRTIVSGLVKFVPLEEMQNRLVVCLCNLKPTKMRGILSEGMVMCASTPEKVEILIPPSNSIPGDRVTSDKYPGEPDSELNAKKKIWEQIAPDLKTNDNCVACYKGAELKVGDKGVIKSPSLANVQVK